jgi:hypothetical protein
MNETTPAKEKQARDAQARADDRAESGAPAAGRAVQSPEDVKEDPAMDEDAHEAHREAVPTAPLGH